MTDHALPPVSRPLRAASSVLTLLAALALPAALHAQGLRPSSQLGLGGAAPLAVASEPTRARDFIVMLVNGEPVTNHEVRQRLLRIEQQITRQGGVLPGREALLPQVLDLLIAERAELQEARRSGLRIEEDAVTQAETSVAAQNGMGLEAFRERLKAEGLDAARLRQDLRDQLLVQRYRERELASRLSVTEDDIDRFMERQRAEAARPAELNLGHVLIGVPENADAATVAERQRLADEVARKARRGEDFATLVRAHSDASDRAQGGVMGLRSPDRLPDLFVEAVRRLAEGQVADPVRSPAGFHVLKLLQRRDAPVPAVSVAQTRARHILLRTGPQLREADALARLSALRREIEAGRTSFEAAAQANSQDGSAREGGDLGWASPGQFVPEFEDVMNGLAPGQVSAPFVSRFGAHLLRVDERRTATLNERQQRELARDMVRERKSGEALERLLRELSESAFVERREEPRL